MVPDCMGSYHSIFEVAITKYYMMFKVARQHLVLLAENRSTIQLDLVVGQWETHLNFIFSFKIHLRGFPIENATPQKRLEILSRA